jgi:hypothetical protein
MANGKREEEFRIESGEPKAADPKELDEMLDEALRETFPASDPVSLLSKLRPGTPRRS